MDEIFEPLLNNDDNYDTSAKYLVLIIYDIIDNKQRLAISKLLLGFGTRIQKSAFECLLTQKQYRKLLNALEKHIFSENDRLAVYKISQRSEITHYGKKELPIEEDIWIF